MQSGPKSDTPVLILRQRP